MGLMLLIFRGGFLGADMFSREGGAGGLGGVGGSGGFTRAFSNLFSIS